MGDNIGSGLEAILTCMSDNFRLNQTIILLLEVFTKTLINRSIHPLQRYRRVDEGPLFGTFSSLDLTPLPITALGLPYDVKKVEAAFPAWDRLVLIADGRKWFEYDGVTAKPVDYVKRCGGAVNCVWPDFAWAYIEAAMKYDGQIYLFADDRRWFVVNEQGILQDSKVCF